MICVTAYLVSDRTYDKSGEMMLGSKPNLGLVP